MSSLLPLHWARPEALLLLIPCAALCLALWHRAGISSQWHKVIAPELLPHLLDKQTARKSRRSLPLLFALAWLLSILAIAGPSWHKLPQPVFQNSDAVVVVLDLSYSMTVKDVQPSRLVRARDKVRQLLTLRKEGQTALVAYAGDAHVVSPLTDDNKTITNLLSALHPGMMPVAGANAAAGIEQALQLLRSAGITRGRILLISDEVSARNAATIKTMLADNRGIDLSVIGVGTAQGAPIPLTGGGFLKDKRGEIVVPQLNSAALRQLASAGGGKYHTIRFDDSDIAALAKALPENTKTSDANLGREFDLWQDTGHWFLLPVLFLALVLFRRGAVLSLMLPLLFFMPSDNAQAGIWQDMWQTPDQQAAKALSQGDAERAAELFNDPQWRATATYQQGDYKTAAKAFAGFDDADGWYNRGNALARSGDYDAAIAAYEHSLELAPQREDALANKALLEKLKREQEQQQQNQEQQEQNQQEQDQQDQNNNQNQQSENSSQENQQQQNQQQNSAEQQDQQTTPPPQQSEQQQDQQQNQRQQDAQSDPEPRDNETEQQQQEQRAEAEPTEQQKQNDQQNAQPTAPLSADELERQQAMEQWLRRVPDDPAGLLRNKFRYESRLRQGQREQENDDDEKFW